MEDILRFDGGLNLSQGNLPPEDYADANNIVIAEDVTGDYGVIKKIADITELADLSVFCDEVLASAIDFDGNQYLLTDGDITISYLNLTDVNGIQVGSIVTQSNGAEGQVFEVNGLQVRVKPSNLTAFSSTLFLSISGTYTRSISSITSFLGTRISILKVDTSGNISNVVDYKTNVNTSIIDPTLKLLGDTLVWNYKGSGELLSWDVTRTYGFFDEALDQLKEIYFIKPQPDTPVLQENKSSGSGNNVFDSNTITFAARYIFDNGEVSSLSSYATFIANPDRSDENQSINGINNVSITILGSHPRFAESIQFYARIGAGPFRRIETKEITGQFNNITTIFTGQLSESLSTEEGNKIFDAVPINAKAIEVSKNRLFLGNITDDLPSEGAEAGITITGNANSEYASGGPSNSIDDPFFYASNNSTNNLTEDSTVDGQTYITRRKVLSNDSTYKLGIAFYDEFGRTRGVVENSVKTFKTGLFTSPTRISSMVVSAATVPSWAKSFKVLSTRNLSKDFSIEGYANSIFYQLEDNDGVLYFSNFAPGDINIRSVVIDIDLSYGFQEGDRVNLLVNGSYEQLPVTSVLNGRIFCEPSKNSGQPYFEPKDLYIEIFSPKDISGDDSTIFYETEEGGLVSELPKTIASPKVYDQTLIKESVNSPVFSKTIDGDTLYHFQGDSDPSDQPGLQVSDAGAIVYNTSDVSHVLSGTNPVGFTNLHSNDHSLLSYNVYFVQNSSHGYTQGSHQSITGALGGQSEYILKVIDNDRYYAAIDILQLTVNDNTGFVAGDPITISTDEGNINGIVGSSVAPNDLLVMNLSYKDALISGSLFNTITDGVTTRTISAVTKLLDEGDNIGVAPYNDERYRMLFSEEKVYVGRNPNLPVSIYGAEHPWNDTNEDNNTTPLIRFEDPNSIVFPVKSGKAKLYYNFTITNNDVSNNISVSIVGSGPAPDTALNITQDPSTTQVYSGIINVELSSSYMSSYSLIINGTGSNCTVGVNSYMYGILNEDIGSSTLLAQTTENWTVSRKPNRRINDDATWDLLQGKPSLIDTGIESRVLENKIRYGGRFINDSIINPISSFDAGAADFVPFESGPITQLVRTNKLDSLGSVVLAICEQETNSIYIGERLITNNDGSTSLAVSDKVIGSIQPLQGSRGSKHRRSISKDQNGSVVWWDDRNKDICRYTREGVVPISDFKVKPYFQFKSGEFVSFYDKFYDMFFFRHTSTGETIGYSQSLRWIGFYDMDFTLGGEQFDAKSFPISTNKVFKTLNSTFNGDYFNSLNQDGDITLSRFSQINFEPRFLRLRGDDLDSELFSIDITNDRGQRTTLNQSFFTEDGSYHYSDIYRDINHIGLYEGIPLQGSRLNVKFTIEDLARIREVYLGYEDITY